MIHFFKFHQELLDPAPARDVYVKRTPGRGWPEECPPVRAANAFGFDVLANFDVTFVQRRGRWSVAEPAVVESDFEWQGSGPLRQEYAWFWDEGQRLPHPIDDRVYPAISNQVKVSSFLYLRTDPNELLLIGDVPNRDDRRWRALSALVETDWYPASYPWHCVLALDREAKEITIPKGEALCRLTPVRRDTYFARPMSPSEFDDFFARGQDWLATHGKPPELAPPAALEGKGKGKGRGKKTPEVESGTLDITRTYGRQQARSRFIVTR